MTQRTNVSLSSPSLSHCFALLFHILEVLGELHADAGHHVFSDELPLSCVIVQLVQDLLQRGVIAESAAQRETIWEIVTARTFN